ncbi:chloramphenicol acetyltransferase CAT [Clostridium felsineum]|uniref:CatA-like O-acetyltransferase n=1 Tax=Clostridium felsineum TaxID=36839 RepID=UPI00214D574D|nr:CatA-like O-acetyltransferase [Clostridium felsineum]MCR3760948.1 chloramphenicol acetyltransferase CAT [Clostridium felsineum]
MNTDFNIVDMEKWPRRESYIYFTEHTSPVTYATNVTMDITILMRSLKSEKLKFYPTYLYLITKIIGKQKEFLMGIQNEVLGYWNCRTPFYPIFHEDDKTMTFLWTEYDENFKVFYERYMLDFEKYKNDHGILTSKGAPPMNNYIISCIPWFTFNSFSMHVENAKHYYSPIVEAGKFTEREGIITMPLSITVNHATVDGYHLKVFFEELQREMNCPEEWIGY